MSTFSIDRKVVFIHHIFFTILWLFALISNQSAPNCIRVFENHELDSIVLDYKDCSKDSMLQLHASIHWLHNWVRRNNLSVQSIFCSLTQNIPLWRNGLRLHGGQREPIDSSVQSLLAKQLGSGQEAHNGAHSIQTVKLFTRESKSTTRPPPKSSSHSLMISSDEHLHAQVFIPRRHLLIPQTLTPLSLSPPSSSSSSSSRRSATTAERQRTKSSWSREKWTGRQRTEKCDISRTEACEGVRGWI